MDRRIRGLVAAVAAFGLAACAQDPLSDLDGSPTAISTSASRMVVSVGGTGLLTASVLDGRSTPLALPVTFAACDASVSVAADATYHPVPATSSRAVVTGVTADTSCVNVTGSGLTAQVTVIVQ